MNCAAVLCFVGIFAEGSIEHLTPAGAAFTPERTVVTGPGQIVTIPRQYRDRQELRNPYGTFAFGARWEAFSGRVELNAIAGHQSSVLRRDQGENYFQARATVWLWRPNR